MLNTVTCGDCIDVMAHLPRSSVDFVLTDPPYLVRYHDRTGRRVINDDNDAWLKPAFAQIHAVLKPDSLCVSFYGPSAPSMASGIDRTSRALWHPYFFLR